MPVIEVVGPSGSGKTTAARHIAALLGDGTSLLSDDIPRSRFLALARDDRVRNVVGDVLLLPSSVRALIAHRVFVRACMRHAASADTTYDVIRAARGILRRVALHDSATGRSLAVLDEGTVQIAHYVFAQARCRPSEASIDQFASLVPVPDLVVHVAAPLDVLVQRTLARVDPPRGGLDEASAERYLGAADRAFRRLAAHPRLRDRWLTINSASDLEVVTARVGAIR